jgi:hypothetical protein
LGQKNPAFINEKLTDAVHEFLNEIKNYKPEDFRSRNLPNLPAEQEDKQEVDSGEE